MNHKNLVITIGRQFGSGGRELGKALADRLSIKYYDKQLLAKAAAGAGIDPALFESNDERMPDVIGGSIGFSMGYGEIPWYSGQLMAAHTVHGSIADMILQIARTESCVIVGRTADYVLRNADADIDLATIFVHAPLPNRIERILTRSPQGFTKEKAVALARKTDRLRASYYNFYTDKRWGDSRSYDLCLDSSLMSIDDLATVVSTYVSLRFPH